MGENGRDWVRTAGDCGGPPGTARVMSHDFNLARTIVPYSPS